MQNELKNMGYELIKEINTSLFGFVGLVHNNTVVKASLLEKIGTKNTWDNPLIEGQNMKLLNHPNIIECLDLKITDIGIYIFMPYYKYGDLFDFMDDTYMMSIEEVKVIIKQILDALIYIDSMGYVYPDLSLENIIIENTGTRENPEMWKIVLIDLGSLIKKDDFLQGKKFLPGKEGYRPPDYKQHFDGQVRINILESYVYSVGVIAYMLTCGRPPYLEGRKTDPWFVITISGEWLDESFIQKRLDKGHEVSYSKNIDRNFLKLIDRCIKYSWSRITMKELKKYF